MSVHHRYLTGLVAAGALLFSLPAAAEWRCDCTKITGSCSGSVTVRGNWVEVASDVEACSRVDYFIDGQPFVTVVVDGQDRQDWVSRTADPDVIVKSCEVCQDNVVAPQVAPPRQSAAPEPAAQPAPRSNAPLIRVDPVYPPAAQARGLQGYVVVEFQVSPDGSVTGARAVEARPRQVFNRAAVEAVSRWRFAPGAEEGTTLRERVDFSLAPEVRAAAAATDSRVGLRNSCVKEGYVYELVEMLEVQLVNVCEEPVVVYSCAEGLGTATGQWSCNPGEDDATALVRRGDPRNGYVGDIDTRRGSLRFAYVEEQFLARPPATRYWWIACGVDDVDCHTEGLRWTGFMHLKPRSVNPQRSSELSVAASL